jgi:retron-type reverse transcriptase
MGFSYGFREKRSQHNALDALYIGMSRCKINYILDADISGFFDKINHEWLLKFLSHRVADCRMLRLIRKWLKVGVVEDGKRSAQEIGTPQGSVISPVLVNIYLHYAQDLWVHQWRKRREASGSSPEGGDDFGKAPLGLFNRHQILTPIVAFCSFLALECNCVCFLHPSQPY